LSESDEWVVTGRPFTTAGGKTAHARVKKVNQPDVTEIRSWGAHERVVKSQGRWIIEAATHSVVSRAVHFGDSEIAAHPEIVDLEPNADARPVAITGRL
jgi:hypothetical protein